MIAVIQVDETQPPHVVKWTGRKGLHIEIVTYCEKRLNASDGVLQVKDDALVCFDCKMKIG